ncbi:MULTISPECIES: A24 family peptidase [Microbacterium]|uniref:prepilin peptidase n=1 Tax=Microbacterium TaxID=33882 RepID=UPI0027868DF0|nr:MULTISPECIES: A24 family peptidase [Microbacterium]MDQ1083599.1 leader peptidase (prepilin peptidase)/N-methyltransferase [Microbacterium sp. SORGH_AS_0344]MDQ1171125.1 leader peptidase (prepilin peptidase)/N-methyltransferase [Microbacterium proteolyticum]
MPWALAPALTVFAGLGIELAVIDVRTHRLPDAILLPGAGAVIVLLAGAAVVTGTPDRALGLAGGAAASFAACLAVHLARPDAFGGGDVKLAGLCGAVLGWVGPEAVASGIALGFVAGGAAATGVVLSGARGASIAFGPFLLAGTWGRLLAGPW